MQPSLVRRQIAWIASHSVLGALTLSLFYIASECVLMRTQSSIYTHSHHTTANSCLHIEWTIISKYNSFCFKCWQVSVRESVHSSTEIRISKWLLKSILYKVFTNNDIYRFECLPATNATGCCKVYGFCMVGEWCKGRQTKWKQSSCSDRHTQNVRQPLQKNLTLDIRMTFVRG